MAAAFRPVNLHSPLVTEKSSFSNTTTPDRSVSIGDSGSGSAGAPRNIMTPSPPTAQPSTAPHFESARPTDDASTPTRATFSPSIAGQQPLPSSPFPQSALSPSSATDRSKGELRSQARDSMDIDMDESDGETNPADDGALSDDESVNADGTTSSKKKKSQRFYCTDYPPCNLSFTRSEHLARHIRFVLDS